MKLGIYTNITDRCGNAEYARYLRASLMPLYGEISFSNNFSHLIDCNVVLVNWHSAVAPFFLHDAVYLKERGIKIVLIHQNSQEYTIVRDGDQVLSTCDAIVAHEPMGNDVHYVPHGIPVVDNLPPCIEAKLGTAGFAFAWKRFDVVAEVAKNFGIKCCVVAARHQDMDTEVYVNGIAGHIPELIELHRDWAPVEDVVRLLATCSVNIFWFQSRDDSDTLGQTGSARMGIAARQPVIISRHRKFRTLFDYSDELYIADTELDVNSMVSEILAHPEKAKRPNRILCDMGWPTVAKKYKEIIDAL